MHHSVCSVVTHSAEDACNNMCRLNGRMIAGVHAHYARITSAARTFQPWVLNQKCQETWLWLAVREEHSLAPRIIPTRVLHARGIGGVSQHAERPRLELEGVLSRIAGVVIVSIGHMLSLWNDADAEKVSVRGVALAAATHQQRHCHIGHRFCRNRGACIIGRSL